MRVDTPAEVAAIMAREVVARAARRRWSSPTRSRRPTRSRPSEIGGIIDQALADMDARGIRGKDATPYLLGRIVEITGGARA